MHRTRYQTHGLQFGRRWVAKPLQQYSLVFFSCSLQPNTNISNYVYVFCFKAKRTIQFHLFGFVSVCFSTSSFFNFDSFCSNAIYIVMCVWSSSALFFDCARVCALPSHRAVRLHVYFRVPLKLHKNCSAGQLVGGCEFECKSVKKCMFILTLSSHK